MNTLQPGPEHKFAFGLWTVEHSGRDHFGEVGPHRNEHLDQLVVELILGVR